jgi:N-acetylneuraminic acid mutarotase
MVMPNVVGVGDQLYLLGSLDVNKSFVYDHNKRTWVARAPLPVPRLGSAAVGVHGTTIFLAGGAIRGLSGNNLNTGVRQSSLLAYDTLKDTWEKLPDLPIPVGYAAGSVIGNEFWVMGGSTNLARTDQVMVYDIRGRRWSTKAPLPVSLSSAAFATIGNHIYLTGGIATESGEISAATMVFDAIAGTWASVAPLPTPRFATHAAVIDGRLYVPTGLGMAVGDPNDGPSMLPTLEVFVPDAPASDSK